MLRRWYENKISTCHIITYFSAITSTLHEPLFSAQMNHFIKKLPTLLVFGTRYTYLS